MLPLSHHAKTGSFQCSDGVEVIDARNLRHYETPTSTSRTSASAVVSSTAPRYSSIALRMFSSASASVAPCDQHPGKPGQDTLTPSTECCRTTRYFILATLPPT